MKGVKLLFLLYILTLSKTLEAQTFTPEELQRRTFHYFWDLVDSNYQIPDRWPNLSFSSIAATGFGLSAYLVGVEHGWVSRADAAERVLKTLKILKTMPQGPEATGVSGYKGFFYHFLDHQKAQRYKDVELSTIDSGLLLAGILSCQTYFDHNNPTEEAIRQTADFIYRRVEWTWMLNSNHRLSMGWKPEKGFIQAEWFGYTEAMILYILALGSPTHPIPADAWSSWQHAYYWDTYEEQAHVNFGPLFGHQYSHVWVDFRGIQDDYMRSKKMDYAENTRRATLANWRYCSKNPGGFKGYSEKTWGLTACDGPADWLYKNNRQQSCAPNGYMGYSARGVAADYLTDDGTIAPTAAGGSVPFAPEICLPALEHMWNTYYDSLVGPYGFKDAFNPGFTACGQLPNGWFDQDYLGIDQGPILLMMENYRTEFLWKLMKKNPYIKNGLRKAGFGGDWLGSAAVIERPSALSKTIYNPEVPNNPLFFFEKACFRKKNIPGALPYRFLGPSNVLASNEVEGYQLNTEKKLLGILKNNMGKEIKIPLIIFLHGSGERGQDNEAQLRNGVLAFCEPDNWKKNPVFILAPQCPNNLRWASGSSKTGPGFQDSMQVPMQLLRELVHQIISDNPAIDQDRIYITGLSMGGFGAFDLISREPGLFAAAMPLCGGGDPTQASKIQHIPMWIFHGTRDETVPPSYSRNMVNALLKAGGTPKYTEYTTLGHSIWQETYYNKTVLDWLFAQKRTH